MPIRNVLICTAQVPFTTGGAESHVEGLRRALVEAGYNAEVAALPFKWYPPTEIMRGTLAWRMLDLTEANGKPDRKSTRLNSSHANISYAVFCLKKKKKKKLVTYCI